MICCDLSPVISHNENSSKLTSCLQKLMFVYIIFEVIYISFFWGDILNKLIIMLFLFLTTKKLHFIFAQITIFFILFELFFELLTLMLIAQNSYLGLISLNKKVLLMEFIEIIILYLIIRATFHAYKEYKAIFFEQIKVSNRYNRFNDMNDVEMDSIQNNNKNINSQNNNNETKKFVPFSGKGVPVG